MITQTSFWDLRIQSALTDFGRLWPSHWPKGSKWMSMTCNFDLSQLLSFWQQRDWESPELFTFSASVSIGKLPNYWVIEAQYKLLSSLIVLRRIENSHFLKISPQNINDVPVFIETVGDGFYLLEFFKYMQNKVVLACILAAALMVSLTFADRKTKYCFFPV